MQRPSHIGFLTVLICAAFLRAWAPSGAFAQEATAADPATGPDEGGKPLNWLIAVGINRYVDKRLPSLRFCENDARGVRDYFVASGIVDAPRAYLLTTGSTDDEFKPLRRNVLQKLDHVSKYATEDSFIVIYIAAHGVTNPGREGEREGYFIPNDGDLNNLDETAFKLNDIHERLRRGAARRTLLLVDACRTPIAETRAAESLAEGNLFEQIRKTRGHFFMASCSDSQVSFEMPNVGHGAFTYFLLEGLTGKAADADGKVTLERLYDYVKTSLRDWADRNTKQVMEPFINIDRWSGDPLVLAFSPVSINLDASNARPDDALWNVYKPTRIDAPADSALPRAMSKKDLDNFIKNAEYIEAYRAFKRAYRDLRVERSVGDPQVERLYWLRHAALVLAYVNTDDLSVHSDFEDGEQAIVQRIGEMRTIADSNIPREILGAYRDRPKAGEYFKKYIALIDKQIRK
ncbi:hypothetical protein JW916_16320 [Candidatus Sumerlaeota bacterium]|nr:hypothetical protein [Candidatus Sumerlaeota bacterium]